MPRKLIETKIIAGEAIHVDQNQIVPITRSICVRPFGFQVGLVWNRPGTRGSDTRCHSSASNHFYKCRLNWIVTPVGDTEGS